MQIYAKDESDTRGKYSSPRTFHSINNEAGIVTVSELKGHKKTKVSVEAIRAAIMDDNLSVLSAETLDQLSTSLDQCSKDGDRGRLEIDAAFNENKRNILPDIEDRIEFFQPLSNRYSNVAVAALEDTGRYELPTTMVNLRILI